MEEGRGCGGGGGREGGGKGGGVVEEEGDWEKVEVERVLRWVHERKRAVRDMVQ